MPSSFPRSPKITKGALVVYRSPILGVIPNVIVFQYNPDQLRRGLQDRVAFSPDTKGSPSREDTLRVAGPPIETISLTIELDAADQLAEPDRNSTTVAFGLNPTLAALELLLYPPGARFSPEALLEGLMGKVKVTKDEEAVPLVLFVWGLSRVLPVRLTGFSISEQAFDPKLNPIRASVDLEMRVLTSVEFKQTTLGYAAYLAYLAQKEMLAGLGALGNLSDLGSALPF